MTQADNGRLAIHGGQPARQNPDPPMYPGGMAIAEEEEQAVLDGLRSSRLFRYYGPGETESKASELERAFAAVKGARHAVAVTSGTAALATGLHAIGIGPGDEVRTYVADGRITIVRKTPGAARGFLRHVAGNPAVTDEESLQDTLDESTS